MKHTDMTIHWKALDEHFLMVPLVFRFNHYWGKTAFFKIFSKHLSPERVNANTWSKNNFNNAAQNLHLLLDVTTQDNNNGNPFIMMSSAIALF
jgi:hypothetical protein